MMRSFVLVLLAFGLVGCQENSGPNLRMDTQATEAVKPVDKTAGGPQVVQKIGENVQVVTGEKATTVDKTTTDPDSDDNTGAMAVKVQY